MKNLRLHLIAVAVGAISLLWCTEKTLAAGADTSRTEEKKTNEKKTAGEKDKEELPKTVEAAVQDIVAKLSEKDKKRLRADKKEDLIQYHHGWGTEIRNELKLWGGNRELLEDCSLKLYGKKRDIHPDSASMVIIEEIRAYLIKNPAK